MTVLLDTSDVAPADRGAFWSEGAARLFQPMGVQPLVDRPFSGRVLGHHLGPIDLFRVTGDANRVVRTMEDVEEADPEHLHVNLVARGTLHVAQDGRSGRLRGGDISTFDTSRPFVIQAQGRFELLTIVIPRAMVGDRALGRTGTRMAGDAGLPRVAGPFFVGVAGGLHDGSIDQEDPDLADGIVGIVRALHADAVVPPPARRGWSRSDAMLRRLKDYIELHLRDPDLGPARIAGAHFISTRYVHKLFHAEGTTVSAWIRARRLEGARRDLSDPALAHGTIAALASAWGFSDPARFSRAFRAAYGCSPTEARAAATLGRLDWD
jgi:AraC-like DNA-binding protein